MKKSYLLPLILVLSCGSPNNTPKKSDPQDILAQKSVYYQAEQLARGNVDSHGFIMTDKCDALLFSGLYSAALGADWQGDITAARSIRADGRVQWFRRPAQDCGVQGKLSHSTISRDMLLGLMWHMWEHKRLDLAVELMEDLRVHRYILAGEGTLGELLVNPAMMNTLAQIIKGLGGREYKPELDFPYYQTAGNGFVSHLSTWHILLRAKILGGVTDNELTVLKELSEREPQNPLFNLAYHKFVDGDLTLGVQQLLDESHYPKDRLPSSAEHCSDWPVQRDHATASKDWEPCPDENETHTGAELIIIYHLIVKS